MVPHVMFYCYSEEEDDLTTFKEALVDVAELEAVPNKTVGRFWEVRRATDVVGADADAKAGAGGGDCEAEMVVWVRGI